MKKFTPIFLIFIILIFAGCNAGYNSEKSAQRLLVLCNEERAASGMTALVINEKLSENAQVRANEIAETGNFSHIRPDGSGCFTTVTVDYSFVGENLAKGDGNAEDVFKKWMASPEHKANIMLPSYTQTGFGCAEKDGTIYWVQLFVG